MFRFASGSKRANFKIRQKNRSAFATLFLILSMMSSITMAVPPLNNGAMNPKPRAPKKDNAPVPVEPVIPDNFDESAVTDVQGTVVKIRVKGNRKIETDSIMSHLHTHAKGPYSPTTIREDVVQLFKTGYFYDVRVDREVATAKDLEPDATPAKTAPADAAEADAKDPNAKAPPVVATTAPAAPVMTPPVPAPVAPAKAKRGKAEKKVKAEEKTSPDAKFVLIYTVVEKPSIAEIAWEGASELKTDELLETTGLKQYEILNMSKVRDAVDKIQKMYEDKGFFLAKVEPVVEDVKKDETVKVTFKIHENDKVKVKKITFLGNQKIKDGTLKSKMITSEGGFFSFVSGAGGYKQDAFDRDMQLLRFVYFNEGYVQVKIDRPKVYVTPDKKNIYITIRIDEGEQFDVGDIDFSGDLLFTKDELAETAKINKQKVFSYEVLQKDLSELQAKYGDLGYAFANVIPRTKINEKERKVDVTFEFDKGNKVYFGQINVIGNSKTRDKVVRRELRIYEGELYNETRKRRSQENIQRLGYFEDVTFKTSTPPDHPDLLNIDIVVKERNTGSVQLGAGYGSATGFSLQGQIQQANFYGLGDRLGAGVTISTLLSTYFVNFTEPHYDDTDWSIGADLYQSVANRYDYLETIKGAAVRVGHPLSDYVNLSFRYRYDQTWLDVASVTPPTQNTLAATPYYPAQTAGNSFVANNGGSTILVTDPTLFPLSTADGDTGALSVILEWDKRNDRIAPNAGHYASVSYEYAGLGGSLDYVKGSGSFRYYHKVFWDLVWRNNLSYSWLQSTNGQPVPFNQKFLLGGPYTLRGYQFARVGKTAFGPYYYNILPVLSPGISSSDQLNQAQRPVGGTQQLLYQLEFEFPLISEANIKGVVFYDAGIADDEICTDNIYSDVGFGFRWFSPIGPLRFEWGFPVQQTVQSPSAVQFQFSIGAPF